MMTHKSCMVESHLQPAFHLLPPSAHTPTGPQAAGTESCLGGRMEEERTWQGSQVRTGQPSCSCKGISIGLNLMTVSADRQMWFQDASSPIVWGQNSPATGISNRSWFCDLERGLRSFISKQTFRYLPLDASFKHKPLSWFVGWAYSSLGD